MISKLVLFVMLLVFNKLSWAQFYGNGGHMAHLVGSFMSGQPQFGGQLNEFGGFQWPAQQNSAQDYNSYQFGPAGNSFPMMQHNGVSGYFVEPAGMVLDGPTHNGPTDQFSNYNNPGHAISAVGGSNDGYMHNFYPNLAASAIGMSNGGHFTNQNPSLAASAVGSSNHYQPETSLASSATGGAVGGNNFYASTGFGGGNGGPTQYFTPARSIRFPDASNTPFFPEGNYVVAPAAPRAKHTESKEADFLIGHLTNINNPSHNVRPSHQTDSRNHWNEVAYAAPAQPFPAIPPGHTSHAIPFSENQFLATKNRSEPNFENPNVDIGSQSNSGVIPSNPFPTFPPLPSSNNHAAVAIGAPHPGAAPTGQNFYETNSAFGDKQPTTQENGFASQVRPFPTLPPPLINAPHRGGPSVFLPPNVAPQDSSNTAAWPNNNHRVKSDENKSTPAPDQRPAFPTLPPPPPSASLPSTPAPFGSPIKSPPASEHSFAGKPITVVDDDDGSHELYIDANGIFQIRKPTDNDDKPAKLVEHNELSTSPDQDSSSINETKIDETAIIFNDNEQIGLNDPVPRVHVSNDGDDETANHHHDHGMDTVTHTRIEPRLHNGRPVFSR